MTTTDREATVSDAITSVHGYLQRLVYDLIAVNLDADDAGTDEFVPGPLRNAAAGLRTMAKRLDDAATAAETAESGVTARLLVSDALTSAVAPPPWTAIVAIPVERETDRMVIVDLEALGLDETWTFCQAIDPGDVRVRMSLLFHPDDGEDRDCPNCLLDPDDAIDAYAG